MTQDRIKLHIKFLKDNILPQVSGQVYIYRNGKNKMIRDRAGKVLDEACRIADRYLEINQDLFDFMVAYQGCDPAYLEYPDWDHIERDTADYIRALERDLE